MKSLAASAAILWLCAFSIKAEAGGMKISVSIQPLAMIAESLGGPEAKIHVVLKPGKTPHGYEPTPGDMRKLAEADLVVIVGLGMDDWLVKMARSAGVASEDVVDLSRALPEAAVIGMAEASSHHGHEHGVANPHYWLDPDLMIKAAESLAGRLAFKVEGEEKEVVGKRFQALKSRLEQLDSEILGKMKGAKKGFVAFHGAWHYFAARYGLNLLGDIEDSPGRAASARRIAVLAGKINQAGKGAVIVIEPQFSPKLAGALAEETGATMVMADPIGGAPGREEYFSLMRFNADVFSKALR